MKRFLLILTLLFLSFNFHSTPPPSGWYQQFLPDVNNMPISDIDFLDSLVGFAVTGSKTTFDTNYILKTTNGGNNWFISYKDYNNYFRVIFLDNLTGYVCGSSFQYYGALYKTTNAGENWVLLNTPFGSTFDDMSVLNEDTIWVTDGAGYFGGLFRTTNGGQSWTRQFYSMSFNPNKIYMYNGNFGFWGYGWGLYRTTNSGVNWNQVPSEAGFSDMYFINSLTGWKAAGDLKKTTDGGLTWVKQHLPSNPNFYTGGEGIISELSFIGNDTVWGVYDSYRFGPGNYRGIIWKSTNRGLNWGYQIPDTSIHIWKYWYIDFINKLNGWAYFLNTGVHTVTGGDDTTIYLKMTPISTEIPEGYRLHQNYPNPFNYSTRIKFEISKTSDVKLKVYNLLGKEVDEITNNKLSAGSYKFKFIGLELSSGVYLYRLVVDGNVIDTKKMILLK